jgi:hypothetical protein
VTPEQWEQARTRLSPHRADQAAVEASNCYAADTCVLDVDCPFIIGCLGAEGLQP